MEKLTYKNVRTKVAGKATGNKIQKSSVASELIFALSKPKIKKEIKEEQLEEVLTETVNKNHDLKDFQATIAKNHHGLCHDDDNSGHYIHLHRQKMHKNVIPIYNGPKKLPLLRILM